MAVAGGGASETAAADFGRQASPCPNPCSCRLLANHGLSETELGIVANLAIETPDEARKLVPTLDVSRGGGIPAIPVVAAATAARVPLGCSNAQVAPWLACMCPPVGNQAAAQPPSCRCCCSV